MVDLVTGGGDLFQISQMTLAISWVHGREEFQGDLVHPIQKEDNKAWAEFPAMFPGTL
jgi:hypothetical protein